MFLSVDLMVPSFICVFIYFLYDIVKNRKKTSFFRKIVFASFLVYLCVIWHLTIGRINIPPQAEYSGADIQLIPFYFMIDWAQMYQQSGIDWFFWNSVKLTFYNVLLLIPFGVYLAVLWRTITFKQAVVLSFLASLTIESLQLVLSATGLIMVRTFDVDDLILNTLGGAVAFCVSAAVCRALGNKKAIQTKGF